ncbi:sigma 54-interacting transcriptional regulator [Clostridiaceae bacterium M8S5]|nr:sigma 54-interacting transcriptional regulator [Clostridiaceae bacterium M8S5]
MKHGYSNERDIYLQTLWENFMNNNPIKQADLSHYVKSSWNRSRTMGIHHNHKGRDIPFMTQIFSKEELRRLFLHLISNQKLKNLLDYLKQLNCTITIYNEQCLYIACLYAQGNDMKDKKHVFENMSEAVIGTNAVACCVNERIPCSVIGGEHYISSLKYTAGYAAPYTDGEGRLLGVIYVVADVEACDEQMMIVAKQLAELFDKHGFLHETLNTIQLYIKILEGITEHTHEGTFFIDEFNVVHGYNQKALEMLDIDKSSSNFKKEILNKLKKMNAYRAVDFEEQLVFLQTEKRRKSFLASNQTITLLNRPVGTLVSIMDIEGMSKWHNKIKGNRATYNFKNIIGDTKVITQLKTMAKRVAETSSNVMIYGESGTGKELLAQAIHNASLRKKRPFVAINCGAMPLELIESELFGYEAGTFTGASKSGKIGKIEFASGGTLFLDEIESMPLSVQIKLLRVLSTNRITRLGGVDEIPVNLRIIAATKKNLLKESTLGKFRADLYYRIQIIELKIPHLRDRKEDIPLITKHLVREFSQNLNLKPVIWSNTFMDALIAYDWPGNVRELSNIVERALIIKENEEILTLDHLTDDIVSHYMFRKIIDQKKQIVKQDKEEGLYYRFERFLLNKILEEEQGNITAAAKRLGISRQTLYRKLRW